MPLRGVLRLRTIAQFNFFLLARSQGGSTPFTCLCNPVSGMMFFLYSVGHFYFKVYVYCVKYPVLGPKFALTLFDTATS